MLGNHCRRLHRLVTDAGDQSLGELGDREAPLRRARCVLQFQFAGRCLQCLRHSALQTYGNDRRREDQLLEADLQQLAPARRRSFCARTTEA